MTARLNDIQVATLAWLATQPANGQATNPQRLTARALATRRLVKIQGRGPRWHAELTEAGRHYVEHGEYPPGHFGATAEPTDDPAPVTLTRQPAVNEQAVKPESGVAVDSPAGKRRSGARPAGDALFRDGSRDPYDAKILITVKEAAWMLSLPEHAIRQAVSLGDLHRVFIGEGERNYRIVYGSLLAWVNSMPRESGKGWW